MYNPVYFNYGIAIHGAQNVPDDPASHGCIRINNYLAEFFPDLVTRPRAPRPSPRATRCTSGTASKEPEDVRRRSRAIRHAVAGMARRELDDDVVVVDLDHHADHDRPGHHGPVATTPSAATTAAPPPVTTTTTPPPTTTTTTTAAPPPTSGRRRSPPARSRGRDRAARGQRRQAATTRTSRPSTSHSSGERSLAAYSSRSMSASPAGGRGSSGAGPCRRHRDAGDQPSCVRSSPIATRSSAGEHLDEALVLGRRARRTRMARLRCALAVVAGDLRDQLDLGVGEADELASCGSRSTSAGGACCARSTSPTLASSAAASR